jgi:hypothetical protein
VKRTQSEQRLRLKAVKSAGCGRADWYESQIWFASDVNGGDGGELFLVACSLFLRNSMWKCQE